jgi:predicted O-linked N-acetylglucosamine transferase (SPINDLY family)
VRSIRNLYALALNLTREQHVEISAAGAHYSYRRARGMWRALAPAAALPADRRMVLAYVSSDLLTGHAVAGSMRRVFELHDTARVRVLLFAVKPDQVIAATLDSHKAGLGRATLVDASQMEQSDLAAEVNARGAHVLIDCNGQTGRESLPAYAMRPAAVQVSPPPPLVLSGHAASLTPY